MSESKTPRNYTANQQKIIKRYYDNIDTIASQRLAELVGELYLAEGKKKDKVWLNVQKAMEKLEVPKSRVEHILAQKDIAVLAELVKELQSNGK